MIICPKCGKHYNVEYYKNRGCCSECGFAFKADIKKDISKEKYNAAIRKKTVEEMKAKSEKKIVRCNVKSINAESEKLQTTIKKNHFAAPKPAQVHADIRTSTDSEDGNDVSELSSSERLFADKEPKRPTSKDAASNDYTPDWNDSIFLNSETLDLDDDNENVIQNEEIQHIESDDSYSLDDMDDDMIDDDTDDDTVHSENSKASFVARLFPLMIIQKIIKKQKEKREEQLESNQEFHFNDDGYYNDTVPDVPPEADIISIKSILKVISIIVCIFLFISFIIYYA